jgi:hypothetical protein
MLSSAGKSSTSLRYSEMATLSLRYLEDDVINRGGEVNVVAEAEGFKGEGWTYMSAGRDRCVRSSTADVSAKLGRG